MANKNRTVRVVILGARGVGKQSLAKKYLQHDQTESFDPAFEESGKQITIDGTTYELDTVTAQPDAQNSLINTGQAFLLLYSITSRQSFEQLQQIHASIKANKASLRKTPIFLVGSKADLIDFREVELEDAKPLAVKLNCQKLFEISAREQVSEIDDMFEKLLREFLRMDSIPEPVNPTTTMGPPATPLRTSASHDPISPLSESPRRSSNVFDRLKFGSLKRKTSLQSIVTRKKSGSFSDSIMSFTSKESRDNARSTPYGRALNGSAPPTSAPSPFKLDIDTSSWREKVHWPTEIIPEEDTRMK